MSLSTCLSKFGITVLNILFWLIGCGLIFMGAYIFAYYAKYGTSILSMGTALLPALILMVVGILAILLGIVGCCSAFKDQKCGTAMFFTILLFIFVGLLTGIILSVVFKKEIDNDLDKVMIDWLDDYLTKKEIQADVDMMQSHLKCCGVDNYTDWLNTKWYHNQSNPEHKYPESCCANATCTYQLHDENLFDVGCYSKLKDRLRSHLVEIAAVGGGFLFLLLLGMIFSCILLVSRRRNASDVPYVGIPDPDGMRI